MNKHTPGPWRWVDWGEGCSAFDAQELRGLKEWVLAAEIEGSCDDARGAFIMCSSPANASLIAAAPDLLAALKAMVCVQGPGAEGPAVEMARAAIAKAEAERT